MNEIKTVLQAFCLSQCVHLDALCKRLHSEFLVTDTNVGIGRGKAKRRRVQVFGGKDYLSELKATPTLFKMRVRMTPDQFEFLLSEMKSYIQEDWDEVSKVKCLDWKNRVLLIFMWMFHYEKYHAIQCFFKISSFQVSKVINQGIPFLLDFFLGYIAPFPFEPPQKSRLSTTITYVIDGTITPILKPISRQHWYFRGDKKTHFLTTMLVVDFDGYIHWMCAGVPGCLHDAQIVRFFQEIFFKKMKINLQIF